MSTRLPEGVTDAGPIAQAQVERMLLDAQPEIARLMPEAIARGSDVAFMVTDPAGLMEGATRGRAQEERARLIAYAAGAPLVALFPSATILHMLRELKEELAPIVAAVRGPRPPGHVPVVLMYGDTHGVSWAVAEPASQSVALAPGDAVDDGEGGFLLSLEGALKVYLTTPLDEAKPEGRARLVAFQARAQAALAAEAIRAQPRELGVVLVEAFGGARLRADFAKRGADALVEAIDATLKQNRQ